MTAAAEASEMDILADLADFLKADMPGAAVARFDAEGGFKLE